MVVEKKTCKTCIKSDVCNIKEEFQEQKRYIERIRESIGSNFDINISCKKWREDYCGTFLKRGLTYPMLEDERALISSEPYFSSEQWVRTTKICDNCGAYLEENATVLLTTMPPEFHFRCPNCGNTTSHFVGENNE